MSIIKTVTTVAGTNIISFPEFMRYFWVKNIGTTSVYVSACSNAAANTEGTAKINSGECVRVDNVDDVNVYVVGKGMVEVHAQNEADCPFKSAPVSGGDRNISFSEGTILYDGSINISIGSPGVDVVLMSAVNNFDIIAISIGDVTTYLNYNSDTDYLRLRFRRQSPVIFFPKVEQYKFELYNANVIEETPTEKNPSISKFLSGSFSNGNKDFIISLPSSRGKEGYISNVKILGFNLGVEI